MSMVRQIEVAEDEDGMRLDRWFRSHYPELGHGALQKLLRSGQVRLDGARVKANARIETGQTVRVPPTAAGAPTRKPRIRKASSGPEAERLRAAVVHRDDDIVAINKPPGLAVQGGSKTTVHVDGLLDALRFDAEERPRLVHRLDRDTSGVLLLGRTRAAARALTAAFKHRETEKVYWALVRGVPRPATGLIDLPVAKIGQSGHQRMAPANKSDRDALAARTLYTVIETAGRRYAWLALSPLTGRTHQLRVHCAAIGHPIVGDPKYGGDEDDDETLDAGLQLHARAIAIAPPNGRLLEIEAELPDHMASAWARLGFDLARVASESSFVFRGEQA